MAFTMRSTLNTNVAKAINRDASVCSAAAPRAVIAAPKVSIPTAVTLKGSFLQGEKNIATLRSASRPSTAPFSLTITAKRKTGESKIGKIPITVPSGVEVKIEDDLITVKGPGGTLSQDYPSSDIVVTQADGLVSVKKTNETRAARAFHGLYRTLTQNMITGVTEGWSKRLQLVGVGYRGSMQGKSLVLNLGYSHPCIFDPPEGITFKVEESTNVIVSGIDKALVGNSAAVLRKKRPPEPYKGKGVRYEGEVVLLKEGKSGK